jgi:hypothetical protein
VVRVLLLLLLLLLLRQLMVCLILCKCSLAPPRLPLRHAPARRLEGNAEPVGAGAGS